MFHRRQTLKAGLKDDPFSKDQDPERMTVEETIRKVHLRNKRRAGRKDPESTGLSGSEGSGPT